MSQPGVSIPERAHIFRNTIVSYAAFAITGLVGLALVPFLIDQLGEEAYGLIGVINAILQFAVLVDLGTRQAATRQFVRFVAQRDLPRANELASTAVAIYAGIALVLGAILASTGWSLLGPFKVPPHLRGEAYAALLVAGCVVATTLLRSPYDAALISQMRHDVPQYVDVGALLLRAGIVVGAFLLWQPRLIFWPLSSLIANLLGLLVLRWQAGRHCPGFKMAGHLVSRRGCEDLAGLSGVTSILRVSDWMGSSGTPLVLGSVLGTAAVAHYAPAIAVVSMFQPLAQSFLTQLVPVVTRAHVLGERERIERAFLEGARLALLTSGAAAALVASVAPLLVKLWLGPGFEDTAHVIMLLCAGEIAQASVGAAFPIWVGIARLGVAAAIALVTASIGLALSVLLLVGGTAGVAGAAIGLVAALGLRVLCDWVRAIRSLGIPIRSYLQESLLGPALSLSGGAGFSLLVQDTLPGDGVLELVSALAAGGLVMAGLAWFVGLTAQDRERFVAHLRASIQAVGLRREN